jgi:hypothetical protein
MSMFRVSILFLVAGAALAQTPADLFNKPPAEVDEALRARIKDFYSYHVNQQFRKAEDLVAEDTREFFYTRNKPQYLSFEIKEIQYSDNFTKAKATIICEQYVMMVGFAGKPMKFPTPSTWKLVGGQWFWYVDQEALRDSPFGKMNPGNAPLTTPVPAVIPDSFDFVLNKVLPDRKTVTLKPGETQLVNIANTAPGSMSVNFTLEAAGINAELDKTSLGAGEKAVLTLKAGANAKSGTVRLRIQPTGETIPIQIEVK